METETTTVDNTTENTTPISDFTPSADFIASFANTHIEGAEYEAQADTTAKTENTDTQTTKTDEVVTDEKKGEKTEEKQEDKPAAQTETPPIKSFDEQLSEVFEGKFKSVDELKKALETPKEEFASDQVKFFNELIKSGTVKNIDNDYIKMVTADYESMENPIEILMEDLKLNDPKFKNADPDELEFEIRQRYKMDEWAPDGEDPSEAEKILSKRQLREATEARDRLIEKRESLKFIKKENPVDEAKVAQERQQRQAEFEKFVDKEVVTKINKLSTPIVDKEGKSKDPFEFSVEPSTVSKVANLMKLMNTDARVFFNQFVEKENFNHSKFAEYLTKAEN